ncbi:MAG: sporulation integral membrane protein YtvI [Candidatus Faecousia sp.]|nr:sporulation integral membrane protein YtvI [Candidatus Faecousia sp.]
MRSGTRKFISLLGIFLAVWMSVRFLLPLGFPFLLGTALALAAEPLVRFLRQRVHLPRAAASALAVSAVFLLLSILTLLLIALLVRELGTLAGILPNLEDAARTGVSSLEGWLLTLSTKAPQSIRPLLRQNIADFFSDGTALVDKGIHYLLGLAGSILGHVPGSALGLFTAIISGYMISAKLPKLRQWFLRRFPREKLRPMLDALKRVRKAVTSWLLAQLQLSGVTFSILLLGYLLLGVSYAPLWALITALVDALPVLGTGSVLLPWSLICLLQGNVAQAVGLVGIYVVVAVTRSVLEPRLLGKRLGLDPLATLIALYVGYKLWGIGGMILSPLLAVTVLQLFPEPGS